MDPKVVSGRSDDIKTVLIFTVPQFDRNQQSGEPHYVPILIAEWFLWPNAQPYSNYFTECIECFHFLYGTNTIEDTIHILQASISFLRNAVIPILYQLFCQNQLGKYLACVKRLITNSKFQNICRKWIWWSIIRYVLVVLYYHYGANTL